MSQHVVPRKTYVAIFLALMFFTALTVWVAFLDLGAFNDVVAVGIAITKATLVILYFMHVRYSDHLTWVYLASGFLFLVILLVFLLSDVTTRDAVSMPQPWSQETPAAH